MIRFTDAASTCWSFQGRRWYGAIYKKYCTKGQQEGILGGYDSVATNCNKQGFIILLDDNKQVQADDGEEKMDL